MGRSAADYVEKALLPTLKRELPPGTEIVGTRITPWEVLVVICVPHHFDQLEDRPERMPVKHCEQKRLHAPHSWVNDAAVPPEPTVWCGGVS